MSVSFENTSLENDAKMENIEQQVTKLQEAFIKSQNDNEM